MRFSQPSFNWFAKAGNILYFGMPLPRVPYNGTNGNNNMFLRSGKFGETIIIG